MAEEKKMTSTVVEYTFAGLLLGLVFPLAASIIEVGHSGLNLSLASLVQVQKENPLLWIINSAILVLGYAGYLAGSRQQKLEAQSRHLEALVENRSQDIIRQKLFYEALVNHNPIAIVTLDKAHRIISINPAFQEMFGYRQEEIMGKEIDPLVANPERPVEAVSITKGVLEGQAMHEVGKRKRKDGTLIDVEIFGQPIVVNGELIGVLGLYRNITMEKRAQDALAASEERFRRMFTDSPIALRMEDLGPVKAWMDKKAKSVNGDFCEYLKQHPGDLIEILKLARIVDLNDATLLLFHAKNREELQNNLHTLLSPESHAVAIDVLCALQRGETSFECEMIYHPLKGEKIYTITKLSVLPGYESNWQRVLFSNMDISDRKMAEDRLRYISLHDLMTALYNRAFFEEEMARFEKSRLHPISILVMDMDNLKVINDRHGHQSGDIALQIIADILRTRFRSEDVVARIGGDEFAVLLPGVNDDISRKLQNRIHEGIDEYNHREDKVFNIGLSIGSATVEKGGSMEEGFKLADQRMYKQKQLRKQKPR